MLRQLGQVCTAYRRGLARRCGVVRGDTPPARLGGRIVLVSAFQCLPWHGRSMAQEAAWVEAGKARFIQ